MRASRRYIRWPHLCRRFTASVALLAYLAASFGLPMPVAAAFKDFSRPYPCMNNPCGCAAPRTAGDTAAARPRRNAGPGPRRTTSNRPTTPNGPANNAARIRRTPALTATNRKPGQKTPAAPGMSFASALRCKGLTTLWVSAGTTPVPAAFVWLPAPVLADRLTGHDHFAFRLSQAASRSSPLSHSPPSTKNPDGINDSRGRLCARSVFAISGRRPGDAAAWAIGVNRSLFR